MLIRRAASVVLGAASVAIACGLLLRIASAPANAGHRAAGPCRDQWVGQAVQEVMGRPANGSGDTGECNPKNYGNANWSSYQDLLNKVVVKMTRKGVAYVFVAPKMAILQGHVAWAYMLDNGTYALGATDAPGGRVAIEKGKDTNTPWRDYAATEAELFKKMRGHYSPSDTYKEYKRTYVASRNVGAAEGKTIELRNVGYGLYQNNCLDHVYAVLEAYGAQKDDVMQWKQTHAAPTSWFRAFGYMDINGKITKVDNQTGTTIPTS